MAKSKVMELAIKIAGKVDKSLGTSTKAANKQLATIQKAANKASTVMTAGLAAMGTGAIAATKYLADLGGEWQTATNQMASATGAAGEELENLRDVMENVYADNFGEDVADVADAVTKRHEHANKADVLDKLSEDGSGNLLFDGKRIDDGKVDVASTSSIDIIPANLRDGGLLIVSTTGA